MTGEIWVTDREHGVRALWRELMPDAIVLDPSELERRLAEGSRPVALVVDGTQFLSLDADLRSDLLALPRLLICTGISLASLPMELVAGHGVAVLAKPFCVSDLEAAVEWLRDAAPEPMVGAPVTTLVQRRRRRGVRRGQPAG